MHLIGHEFKFIHVLACRFSDPTFAVWPRKSLMAVMVKKRRSAEGEKSHLRYFQVQEIIIITSGISKTACCVSLCVITAVQHLVPRVIKFVRRFLASCKTFIELLWQIALTAHVRKDITYTSALQYFLRDSTSVLLSSIRFCFPLIAYLPSNLTSGLSSIFHRRAMTQIWDIRRHALMRSKGFHRQGVPDLSLSTSWV